MCRAVIIALALTATPLGAPVLAAATDWQELGFGARARLISSDVLRSDGTTMVGIEVDMPAHTKTYWRIPGETGIPTRFDLGASVGLAGHEVLWPYPEIDTSGDYTDFAYYGPTVLPLELDLDQEVAAVAVTVQMGICSDICVPAEASFTLPLSFGSPDPGNDLRLNQAAALAPLEWTAAPPPLGQVTYDPAAAALLVPVGDPRVDPLSLIADAGPDGPGFGAPRMGSDGAVVILPVLGRGRVEALADRFVELTFMTDSGAFSLSSRVHAPAAD